ncbi:MAG: hypothetical protein HY421_00110 [Candidatus Kerfeldbacteria bacterium]|nr:hypothetical protein [Candidatus Kerfeldbacteria bacterium]
MTSPLPKRGPGRPRRPNQPVKKRGPGSALLMALIFTAVVLTVSVAIFDFTSSGVRLTGKRVNEQAAIRLAEAGVDKAVWCLNNPSAPQSDCPTTSGAYIGESNIALGNGTFSSVVSGSGSSRTVTSTGTLTGANGVSKTIKATLSAGGTGVAFHYGVQVGQGGLDMDNNSYIAGDVYSNGSIIGKTTQAQIRGTAIVAGGTALNPDQQQNVQTSDFTVGNPSSQEDAAQSFRAGDSNYLNKVSLYIKKVSTPNDATVRIVTDTAGSPSTTALTTGTLNAGLVTGTYGWVDVTFSSNPALLNNTTYWIVLDANSNSSKYYVWGKHDNSGYGNGVGKYSSDWDANPWNDANGDFGFKTWMGGVVTKLKSIKIPSSVSGATAHANTIEGVDVKATIKCTAMTGSTVSGNVECGAVTGSTIAGNVTAENVTDSTISGNLTCETQSANTVAGTINCPTSVTPPADPSPLAFPISDGNVNQWKADAQAGVPPISGDHVVSANSSLGPKEITGNLSFNSNNLILTVTGTIYVHGTVSITNGSKIKCAAAYSGDSCIVMADGSIDLTNNGIFEGSGTAGSYVMLLTTSNCLGVAQAGCAPNNSAIYIANNAIGAIFYATQGQIYLKNGVALTEATGYKLKLEENANVTYQSGLVNTNFVSGPGGAWVYKQGSYQIL